MQARLRLGALCDCPRHLREASGYDGCTCAAVDDVDPACPHVRRLRVEPYQVEGGGWAVPCGPLELPIQAQADLMGGRAFVDLPAPAHAAVVSAAAAGRTR